MTLGLQIRDAANRVTFDTNFVTSRVLGVIPSIGLYAMSGSVSDARFATGRPFALLSPKSIGNTPYGFPALPTMDIGVTGTTLNWIIYDAGGQASADCGTIIYGVY